MIKKIKNEKEQRLIEPLRHTKWSLPTDIIDSQYGYIPIEKWLLLEKERVENRNGRAKIFENSKGEIAIFFLHIKLSPEKAGYYAKKNAQENAEMVS